MLEDEVDIENDILVHIKKFRWYILFIAITPSGENYQQRWTHSVRKYQINRDARWKTITT